MASMAWTILVLAGLLEVAWAVGMKYTDHFTRPAPTVATIAAMIGSVLLLERAASAIPLGTAYAVWTGIGVAGTVVLGMMMQGDPFSWGRLFCVALILAGILGLRLLGPN